MIPIKTIGFSLTVLPARLQRLFLSNQIAGSGFILTVILLHCLLTAGCVREVTGGVGDRIGQNPNGGDDYYFNMIEIENSRFELSGIPDSNNTNLPMPLKPARAYWVREGDQVAAKWDTFEFHWEQEKMFCSFNDNTPVSPDEKCLVCDACKVENGNYTGLPCLGAQPVFAPGEFSVVADAGFIQTPNPETVLSMSGTAGDFLGGCPDSRYRAQVFTPVRNGLYRISSQLVKASGEAKGEARIHVVKSGASMSQKYIRKLNHERIDGTDYWFVETTGNEFWVENFSPNLRVTDIRILKATCEPDPTSGNECESSGDVVKPSRLFFLPDFAGTVSGHLQETINRCYSITSLLVMDGSYINLDRCRNTYSTDPQLPTTPRIVTPTYDPDNSSTPNNSLRKLTWLVEFNTGEGADSDLGMANNQTMPTTADLIIEFIIEAR